MPEPQFRYPAELPILGTRQTATREAAQKGIPARIKSVAGRISNFNPRTLNSPPVMHDLAWIIESFWRVQAMADKIENFPALDLPPTGDDFAIKAILERIIATPIGASLQYEPLPDEYFRPPVKLPTWSNDRSLANPFLSELDGDPASERDRNFLEKFHPEIASWLKLEGRGGPSYEELFKAKEELRLAKEARDYDSLNPFFPLAKDSVDFGGTEVGRHAAIKMVYDGNRTLAEQLKKESELSHPNPFSQFGENLSKQMVMYRADLSICWLLDVAGRAEIAQTAAEDREFDAANKARIAREQDLRMAKNARRMGR